MAEWTTRNDGVPFLNGGTKPIFAVVDENGKDVCQFLSEDSAKRIATAVNRSPLFPALLAVLDDALAAAVAERKELEDSPFGGPVQRQREDERLAAKIGKLTELKSKCS